MTFIFPFLLPGNYIEQTIMKNKFLQINIRAIKLFVFIASATGLITSCSSTFNGGSADVPTKVLAFPKADYYAVLQVEKDKIAFSNDANHLIFYAKEGDQSLKPFTFPNDSICYYPFYDMYETLPGGRLQVWKQCLTGDGTLTYLMAYDWQTGQLEQLSGPLPLGSSEASWNPDETKAIGYLDSKFADKTLFWIWKGGFGSLDLVIGDQNHSWNLKDNFPNFQTKPTDTGKTGTTGRAAWSPDGKQIAFFASPDAIGVTGFDRFNVDFNLYLRGFEQSND